VREIILTPLPPPPPPKHRFLYLIKLNKPEIIVGKSVHPKIWQHLLISMANRERFSDIFVSICSHSLHMHVLRNSFYSDQWSINPTSIASTCRITWQIFSTYTITAIQLCLYILTVNTVAYCQIVSAQTILNILGFRMRNGLQCSHIFKVNIFQTRAGSVPV
jgi:hypothetical protein